MVRQGAVVSESVLTDREREMLEQTPVGRAALAEIGRLTLESSVLVQRLTIKQGRIELLETELAQKRRLGPVPDGLGFYEPGRCPCVDGGPMGTDARCTLAVGHAGGCRY